MFPIFIGTVLGAYMFYMAHKINNEKMKDPESIFLYFFVMPYMIAAYWASSIVHELFKTKRKW